MVNGVVDESVLDYYVVLPVDDCTSPRCPGFRVQGSRNSGFVVAFSESGLGFRLGAL